MTFNAMSNEALTALLASKIPSVAHRAAAVLNKRKCKVATEGKRTGLPKLKTLAEEFGFNPQSFKKFCEENSHKLP